MPLTPQQLAELQRLKELMRPQADEFERRMKAIANTEKGSGQGVSLPTDKKAKGGSVMGVNVASDRKAGLNYADLIVDGHKTLESRNTDSLRPYVGKRVAIVRTGHGPAKAIGEVTIGEPMVVNKKKFRSLERQHMVPEGSAFDINTPTKHLYPLSDPQRYEQEHDVGHGIVARKVMHKADGGQPDTSQPYPSDGNVDLAEEYDKQKSMLSQAIEAAKNFTQNTAAPAVQSGLDAVFPFRKMGNIVIDQNIVKPIRKAVGNQYQYMDMAGTNTQDAENAKFHQLNAVREMLGMKPLVPANVDLFKGEELTPYTQTQRYPKHGKPKGKATGGTIPSQDVMRLATMAKGGLAKFLKDSASKQRLYHGTTYTDKPISKFEVRSYGADFGPGIYMTTNPETANIYARGFQGKQGAVYPVYANIKNPLRVKDKYEMNRVFDQLGINKPIHETLQDHGYDGIHVTNPNKENKDEQYFVAFHPHQIKSAIGNRGTYDPTNPDITKAHGGITHAHHLEIEERPL